MTLIQDFDLVDTPLEGMNLIEAGAGTGKTYAITGLFLRLILEKGLSVNEILVVTFTEAATNELIERIHRRLGDAVKAFSGNICDDEFLRALVKKNRDHNRVLGLLHEALRTFDQASIFTIHGFCRRILSENAFESGSLFDTELVADQEDLKKEIVDDFWRRNIYTASPLFVNYALEKGFGPDDLISLLGTRIAQPYLRVIPESDEEIDTVEQEKEFVSIFNRMRNLWQSHRDEIEDILLTDPGLSRVKYGKTRIPLWIQSMDRYMSIGVCGLLPFKEFVKFTTSELKSSVKKGFSAPEHPVFDLCDILGKKKDELEELFRRRLLALRTGLFDYVRHELSRRKRLKNIQSFDDLLLRLHKALDSRGGGSLADAIRAKFRAALVDEFQDTDPLQYAIFKKVFHVPHRMLFLIGDPKQAIYGFRGADIFTYMTASRDVYSRYTLKENWRTEPGLITAVNAVFSRSRRPFLYDEIPFQPAVPAGGYLDKSTRWNGLGKLPFKLWFVDAHRVTGSDKAINKTDARKMISDGVAVEISRLLAHCEGTDFLPGEKGLAAGDICVLVRKNAEAVLMQEALSSLRIPSVIYSTANLFDSREAEEVRRILAAIIDYDNGTWLNAALVTDMLGMKGEQLERLIDDETAWEKMVLQFRKYHDMWEEHGFIRMFRFLLSEKDVLPRLMSLPDGERRNTNILHLAEVLHEVSVQKRLGMGELLEWLEGRIDPNGPKLEEHQLRLESDENAVKITTIHRSKGLEYPVVFCPFSWDGSRIRKHKDPVVFHDEREGRILTLDVGSREIDKNRVSAEKEILAENLRLLYVALTRAKYRCYMVWGRFNEAGTSAPAYLFHGHDDLDGEDIMDAIEEKFKYLSDDEMLKDLKMLARNSGNNILVSGLPVGSGDSFSVLHSNNYHSDIACREFTAKIDLGWRISSFSSLVSGRHDADEMPDHDPIGLPGIYTEELDAAQEEAHPEGMFAFPKGVRAGTFLHDLLEHLDFTEDDIDIIKGAVSGKLVQYGFETTWTDTICDMVLKVLGAPLDKESPDLRLSSIEKKDRLNELEFYFPLKMISSERLKEIITANLDNHFSGYVPEVLGRLKFAPVRGFMRGFMDLVFRWGGRYYLLDWKSNFLGARIEDYDRNSLARAMDRESYVLQYIIYTMALDQYLRLRQPGYRYERDFGGVYYIFLRGVDPGKGPDFGVYKDRPSHELINILREELIG